MIIGELCYISYQSKEKPRGMSDIRQLDQLKKQVFKVQCETRD
jgi:hypothetical protein